MIWTAFHSAASVGEVTATALDLLAGFGFSISLIAAIGAQNAYVLRMGIRREHVLPLVAICAGTDALLILAGTAGVGALVEAVPWLLTAIRYAGAAFLVVYGLLAARRALRPGALVADAGGAATPLRSAVLSCLAITWLNPHVYLDTVALLGSVANAQGEGRWLFAGGAAVGSLAWFTALGFGARFLRPLFRSPRAWRVLDLAVAAIMLALAAGLVLGA